MTKEMVHFGIVVVAKDKIKFLDLNDTFEKVLDAYEERWNKINQLENMIAQMDKNKLENKGTYII